jgi:hypothetical protein
MSDTAAVRCTRLDVSPDACYVRFAHVENHGSRELPFRTVRGEMLIGDFDHDGRLIGIELVGSGKPCQNVE